MSISMESFRAAQSSELENWVKHTSNDNRILYELSEHSTPAAPLRRLAGTRHFERGLDVGVGCFGLGFLAVHVADLVDAIDGLDPLPRLDLQMHDPALQSYIRVIRDRVNYIQSMAESIPAPDATYDLVVCINVVDHAKDPPQILREISRVLKPGGIFAFGVSTLSLAGEMKWKFQRWRDPQNWHFLAHPHTYQWSTANELVGTVRGTVLWSTPKSRRQNLCGKGGMSFWIIQKD